VSGSVAGHRQDSVRRWEWLVLVAILLLATVLRVGWPRLTEFKFSEARLEALALELTREGRLPLVGVPSSAGFDHSPLSVYLYAPAFLLTTNPLPATIYGGLLGVAAVAMCWWLARRWPGGGPWAAAVTATLFATSPWAVAFSRKIWQVVFVPLLALLFVALIISALVRRRHGNLAWALVAYAFLVQVHPSAVALVPALALWLIVFWREVRLRSLLVGGLLGVLSALPFLVHQIQSGWPVLAAYRALPEARWDLSAVRLAWEAVTGRGIHALAGDAYPLLRLVPQMAWLFNFVGWLAVAAVVWLAWRTVDGWRAAEAERRQSARINLVLLTWLLVPVVFNLRHSLELHLHFFALLLPVAYLLIGRAVEALLAVTVPGVGRRALQGGSVAVAMGLGLAQVAALLLMARFVATHETPGGFDTPLGRYLEITATTLAAVKGEGAAEVLVVGEGDSVVVDPVPAIFDVLLRNRVGYRFVDGQSTVVFPPQRAVVLLTPRAGEGAHWYGAWPTVEAAETAETGGYYGGYSLVALDGSWPRTEMEPIDGPRLFENGIEFQNYRWQEDGLEGRSVQFWLLWQVLWQSAEDTHFYAQVFDAQGQPWAQEDIAGYPLAYRRKGDRILSKFDITLSPEAPGGPYGVRVGLYLYPQVENLSLVDQAGNSVGHTVTIGP